MTDTQQLLELALKIARQAGELLVDRPASWDLTVKSSAIDIATQMDIASEKLIVDNFHRNPTFQHVSKTSTGYSIQRYWCKEKVKVCDWVVYISMDTNVAKLTCNKVCKHKNPIKRPS